MVFVLGLSVKRDTVSEEAIPAAHLVYAFGTRVTTGDGDGRTPTQVQICVSASCVFRANLEKLRIPAKWRVGEIERGWAKFALQADPEKQI